MKKIFILSAVIFLSIGAFSVANASGQNLSGYVYSESAGWISLSCANTNSCDKINYKVSVDDLGKLSGYGYSQNQGWINFNPNYGGVSIGSDNSLSGWAYCEKAEWLSVDGAKIVYLNDLQNITDLNSLCKEFLSSSESNIISE